MRLNIRLLVFLCLASANVVCQERVREVQVGPNGDQTRIVVAFIEVSDESYNMQSMIIDVDRAKSKTDQPTSFHVDLTTTVRSLSTGKKSQNILLMRLKKAGEIELKYEGNWEKQETTSAIEKILDATKAVIQNVPLDIKTVTKVTLPNDVEQKVTSSLASVSNGDFPCIRKPT